MGCEASGTTLLSLILDSHSRLAVCRGTYYYSLFAPERRYYGDLRLASNVARLIDDFVEMARAHRIDAPDSRTILRELQAPTFEGVLATFLHLYARERGKQRAGERSAKQYLHLPEIVAGFPASPIVFTMRDPRDVAVAHKAFGFDAGSAAAAWSRAFERYQAASNSAYLVRYEDLVRTASETLAAVCTFVGEGFEPGMLSFFEHTPDHYRELPHHQRLFGPLSSRFVGEFRHGLTTPEVEHVESRCADGMRALRYDPVSRTPARSASLPASRRAGWCGRARSLRRGKAGWHQALRHRKIVLRARVRHALRVASGREPRSAS